MDCIPLPQRKPIKAEYRNWSCPRLLILSKWAAMVFCSPSCRGERREETLLLCCLSLPASPRLLSLACLISKLTNLFLKWKLNLLMARHRFRILEALKKCCQYPRGQIRQTATYYKFHIGNPQRHFLEEEKPWVRTKHSGRNKIRFIKQRNKFKDLNEERK